MLLSDTTADGLRVSALIAVRLTEDAFAPCSGYTDPDNAWRDTCRVAAPFGGHPNRCRLLQRHGSARPRPRYSELLVLDSSHQLGGCPYRTGTEQLRMIALATALREDGEYDRIAVVLCTPAFQEPIQRRWITNFPVGDDISVNYIPVEVVVAITGHPDAALLQERYGIGTATQLAGHG